MNKSDKLKTTVLICISATAIILLYFVNLKSQETIRDEYENYFILTNEKSVNLTRSYQDQITLWQMGSYSNITMADITEKYLKNFTNQMIQFNNTDSPPEFVNVKENLLKSFQNEIKSYELFQEYLETNNSTKNNLSTDHLSESLKYESLAIQEFKKLSNPET